MNRNDSLACNTNWLHAMASPQQQALPYVNQQIQKASLWRVHFVPQKSRGGAESDHDTEEGEESESESDISDDRDMDRSFTASELAELESMQDE